MNKIPKNCFARSDSEKSGCMSSRFFVEKPGCRLIRATGVLDKQERGQLPALFPACVCVFVMYGSGCGVLLVVLILESGGEQRVK